VSTRVLYVEDDFAQRQLVTQWLELRGFEIELAENGAVGYQKARQWLPDVILMDLHMPNTDGLTAIEKLRGDPTTQTTPIIVTTAWTLAQYERRALQLGADHLFTKPYNFDDLVEVIKLCTHQPSRGCVECSIV
jgi:CheY-like chemotaxis protein